MSAWNELILAATLMNDPTSFTLPVQLQRYVSDFSTEWWLSLERRLTQGGVKG